jgi:hypothetical protein
MGKMFIMDKIQSVKSFASQLQKDVVFFRIHFLHDTEESLLLWTLTTHFHQPIQVENYANQVEPFYNF